MVRPASSLQPDRYELQSIDCLDDFDHAHHGDNVFSIFGLKCPRHTFLLTEAECSITGSIRSQITEISAVKKGSGRKVRSEQGRRRRVASGAPKSVGGTS